MYLRGTNDGVRVFNERENKDMTAKEYNETFFGRYSAAYCAITNLDHAIEKCNDPESMRTQLICVGLNEDTKEFLLEAIAHYRESVKNDVIKEARKTNVERRERNEHND